MCIRDRANTKPVVDSVDIYKEIEDRCEQLPIKVWQAAAVSKGFEDVYKRQSICPQRRNQDIKRSQHFPLRNHLIPKEN